MIKLSIIIPIYNVEKYIAECLQSILNQHSSSTEILCIDDGSTDSSGKICDKYSELDNRIKVIHQANKGVAYARNLGVSLSKGEYIAWVDPDDTIDINWSTNIYNCINKDIDFIVFDYVLVKNNIKKYISYRDISGYLDTKIFLYDILSDKKINSHLWRCVFKKKLFDKIRFPESTNIKEDYAVLPYVIKKAQTVYYIAKCLYYYNVRKNSLSTDYNFNKAYKCYVIGKERYTNFKNLTTLPKPLSKDIYLLFAVDCCIFYYKGKNQDKLIWKNQFIESRKDILNNKLAVFYMKNIPFKIKVKYILVITNFLNLALIIKQKLSILKKYINKI